VLQFKSEGFVLAEFLLAGGWEIVGVSICSIQAFI
jgi:hypothetical protein